MKFQGSHIGFLVIGLAAGYLLCAVLPQRQAPGLPAQLKPSRGAFEPRTPPPDAAKPPGAVSTELAKREGPAQPLEAVVPADAPVIWVETTSYDAGLVPNDTKTVRQIKVTNTGSSLLEIKQVKTGCGCTAAAITEKSLEPNASTALTITIDPKKIHGFTSKKPVTIFSNDPANPRMKIDVLARIDPEFLVEPENIDFGTVEKGSTATATVTVRQLGDEPIDVLAVKPWGRTGGVECAFEKVPADQWATPNRREYQVTAKLLPTVSPGRLVSRFRIQTTCKRMPFITCVAKAQVHAFYAISPQNVVLHGSRGDVERPPSRFTVVADRPFELLDMAATDDAVLVSAKPGKTANTMVVELRLAPDATPGARNEKVTFRIKSATEEFQEQVDVRTLARNPMPRTARPMTPRFLRERP